MCAGRRCIVVAMRRHDENHARRKRTMLGTGLAIAMVAVTAAGCSPTPAERPVVNAAERSAGNAANAAKGVGATGVGVGGCAAANCLSDP